MRKDKDAMKSSIKFKTTTSSLLVLFAFCCFAFFPLAQAVLPPPDGAYPGGNTAEGQSALLNLTTGGFNTAVGFLSLRGNTDSSFNTAVGAGSLLSNTADNNTATGAGALLSNTTGNANTASGGFALANNTTGNDNAATGAGALMSNTTGSDNTATGASALALNITGFLNTANGFHALNRNTTGSSNTAAGGSALLQNTIGHDNTATGGGALFSNIDGNFNTATGVSALASNSTGSRNAAVGGFALEFNATGSDNTAIGDGALGSNISGDGNIALGSDAGSSVTDANNVICIGHSGLNVSNSCFIENIRSRQVGNDAVPVLIDSFGKLGTGISSRRFKKEIKPMGKASEAILRLKPVTFHYKSDKANTAQFGLIAEEVAEVNPELVISDKEGNPYTVRYDAVNAMLLNEFLKEHRKVQELEATVAEHKKAMQVVMRRLEEQAADIQKIGSKIDLNKAEPRTVASN
jgi:trimeric autotransporter adhesin